MSRFLLAISFFLALVVQANAADYLVDLRFAGKSLGYHVLGESDEGFLLDASAFQALGLPVKEPQPLKTLEEQGEVNFDRSKQILRFQPKNSALFLAKQSKAQEQQEPDLVLKAPRTFELKNIDYQASYFQAKNTSGQVDLLGNFTGRLFLADFDLRLSTNPADSSSWNMQWHDEQNAWLKDAQIGRITRDGIDGYSISNEPIQRFGDFGSETIGVWYPIGTRVEVYRGADYIDTLTVETAEPLEIPLELVYGTNIYRLIAYLPTGEIREEQVERNIDGYLIPAGELRYRLASGRQPYGRKLGKTRARLGFGLTNRITIESEYKSGDEISSLGAYYRACRNLLLKAALLEQGYEGSLSWTNGLNFNARLRRQEDNQSLNGSLALRWPFSPILTYSETKTESSRSWKAKASISKSFNLFSRRIYLSPFVTTGEQSNSEYRSFGARSKAYLPKNIALDLNFEREIWRETERSRNKIDLRLVKRFDLGEASISHKIQTDEYGSSSIKTQQSGIALNLYKWDRASLNLRGSYNIPDNGSSSWSVTVGVSGSLTKAGAVRHGQSHSAIVAVQLFNDLNGNKKLDAGEAKDVQDLDLEIEGRQYSTKNGFVMIPSLTPYRTYDLRVAGVGFGVAPSIHNVRIETTRGAMSRVEIPIQEIVEIEGQLASKKDKISVALFDQAGNLIQKTKTACGGYWLFLVPADQAKTARAIPHLTAFAAEK